MKLIVGLGNIGMKYRSTRHNLGFTIIDMLAITFGHSTSDFKKQSKAKAEVLDLRASHNCMLIKPTTMMNLSGTAIQELAHFYKVDPTNVWVIYDDVDLPFGQMRVRQGGGSSGGHNGVKSITQHIGDGFWRVRLGIGNEQLAVTPTDAFVMARFNPDEQAKLPTILGATASYLESALLAGNLVDETRTI